MKKNKNEDDLKKKHQKKPACNLILIQLERRPQKEFEQQIIK